MTACSKERWPPQQKQGAIAPLQNKLGAIRSSWPLRNILGQAHNKLELDEVFAGKILIVELRRTHLGSGEKVRLFGSLLLHDLLGLDVGAPGVDEQRLAARAAVPEDHHDVLVEERVAPHEHPVRDLCPHRRHAPIVFAGWAGRTTLRGRRDAPWPPNFAKQPGEPRRVQPSRRKKD